MPSAPPEDEALLGARAALDLISVSSPGAIPSAFWAGVGLTLGLGLGLGEGVGVGLPLGVGVGVNVGTGKALAPVKKANASGESVCTGGDSR